MQSAYNKNSTVRPSNRLRLSTLALSLSLAFAMAPALAQNTTSALGGLITGADGSPAAGAQVTIVHIESGSVSNSVTDATGRYAARGLRPGGPYTVTITKNGVTEKRENVFLQLAEVSSVDAQLGGAPIASMTITGTQTSDKFSKANMGAGSNISRSQLDALASVQRNLQDYARTDARLSQTDKERGEISAGGQNSRYNSITIDGVGINDTFGLEANGLPTAKQPISIDAIQSVQVNVSNYDTTQKGYTGANINAVTKSGTNAMKGSVYYVFRDDRMVGMRLNQSTGAYFDVPDFKETTKGVTLGGPIIKDKLFFFASYEDSSSSRSGPTFGPVGSSLTNVGISPTAIASAQALAKSKWGMDIGSIDAAAAPLTVKDALIKLDWNINDDHRASLRYAKTEQAEPIIAGFSSSGLSLSSWWWTQNKVVESVVGQWFGDWSENFSTEFKVSSRDYDSVPANNAYLPAIGLQFSGALPAGAAAGTGTGNRFLNFGTENSRQLNMLRTKTLDAYFGGNWNIDKHAVKFGVDYSKNDVYNAFLQNVNGNYTFNCTNSSSTFTYSFGAINCGTATSAQVEAAVLENFNRGRPSSYQVQVPVAGKALTDAIAQFSLINTGAFLQDTWDVSPKLSIMYGVRLDVPTLDNKPAYNAAASAAKVAGSGTTRQSGGFGMDNSNTIDGKELFQPRFGFNYKVDHERQTQLRGGFGLFQGAAANVWMSNPFSNTGVATRIIGCGVSGFAACPPTDGTFNPDPTKQKSDFVGAVPAANVDFIGASLGQPAVWKANFGAEHALPFGDLVLGMEYLHTKVHTGIHYQHLNLGTPTGTGTDGRELFYTPQGYNAACWTATGGTTTSGACTGFRARALSNPNFNNVLVADKSKKGGGNLATLSLTRPMIGGWSGALAYTYTDATEVSPLTSSVANSNFNARSIFNPNEDVAANSAYLVKDRVNATLQIQQRLLDGYKTTFGMFYEGRTGKPYSWTFNNDLNGDGVAGNDLMYIPSAFGSGEVVFRGDTATSKVNEQRFWDIVTANGLGGAAGKVVERNSGFAQWTNNFDMRISQEIPGFFKGNKAVFVLDFLNVGNMLNKNWGRIDEILFQSAGGAARSFVNYGGLDASGKYVYNVQNSVEQVAIRQARGESQWAIQATVRYEF